MAIRKHTATITVDVFAHGQDMTNGFPARVRSALAQAMDKGTFLADMDTIRIDITEEITP